MKNTYSKVYQLSMLALLSTIYFLITAATFTSLGVVLPSMINEMQWSWSSAGLGFTLLGLACGLSSYLPAMFIRRLGVRQTFLLGALILASGFALLACCHGLVSYLAGMILLGTGFSFVATVPGTYVIGRMYKNQAFAFGFYFTVGGLGGVVGPLLVVLATDVLGSWRMHWELCGIFLTAACLLAAATLPSGQREREHAEYVSNAANRDQGSAVYHTDQAWTARQAMGTWQFYAIAAAYTTFLLVGITTNSFAVAHITDHGFSPQLAAALLSAEALINSFSRSIAGIFGEKIEPKKMLISSLLLMVGGTLALSAAASFPMLIIFAIGVGAGYGAAFLATSVLLSNYFGRGPYLEIFSAVNLISTLACFGPLLAGRMKDDLGSFSGVFLLVAIIPMMIVLAIRCLKPPVKQQEFSDLPTNVQGNSGS
ncbi:MFS transporter [Pseudoduganella namucuonensis]|uniref:Cyanate permease n=1 Tax=Pseudoduganella namucuonensis TaxID=1035707 RepID=A0A1I7IM56_9BURK|nr:MFS transporter [Pseudoduganella namucuonensis]SFU73997.1 Cyanate permease [Pseudoduganella namucuonensis]